MKYRIMICGTIPVNDQVRTALTSPLLNVATLGFATTRVVTAPNRDEACELAIDSAHRELRSSLVVPVEWNPSSSPTFTIEEIEELLQNDGGNGPKRGFTFYPETRVNG